MKTQEMKTKRKKSNFKLVVLFAFIGLFLQSCDDDDDPMVAAPIISDFELGIGNSHVAYLGSDIHVEAEIVAEGIISTIEVEIHQEGDVDANAWEYDYTYDEFSGLMNTTFHKHIDVPSDIATGSYHFHFIVTDMEGNQTVIEEDLEIEQLDDTEVPVITVTAHPTENESFSSGQTINISGSITDNVALSGMIVALVRTEDAIADADVSGSNPSVIVMMHTHSFDTADATNFNASINVGAEYDNNMTPAIIQGDNAWQSGEYYIVIKTSDANSNGAISQHYPIIINL